MAIKAWLAGSLLVQKLTPVPPVALPTELFPGVEKPTVTLAKMLCAEMLQNLDAKQTHDVSGSYDFTHYVHAFPSMSMRVMAHKRRVDDMRGGRVDVWSYSLSSVTTKDKSIVFDEQEKKILLEGWETFWKLRSTYDATKREEARQHTALSCIETFFKPKETPCVELKPVAEKSSKTPAGPPPSAVDALLSPVAS